MVAEIKDFLGETRVATRSRQEILTLLMTDVVSSTETISATGDRSWHFLLDQHRSSVRLALRRFGGTEIDTAGDGFLARFNTASSAIQCALELVQDAHESGYQIRAGIHTAEVTLEGKTALRNEAW
jgi:class 3 adenylate cyclase